MLVAIHDIPARAAATSDLFVPQQRIAAQVDSDAISDPKELAGNYTLVAMPAGSVATRSKISLTSAATLPARLPMGMRAISISIDNVKGVAGLVTPGDRVDVIAVPPATAGEPPRGYAIVRGALVLAMGTDVETQTAATPGPLSGPPPTLTTVTLALTPNQADLIAGADVSTTLRLALRNPNEPISAYPPEALSVAPPVAAAPPPAAAPPAAAIPAPVGVATAIPARAAPARPAVTIIDGDRVNDGTGGSP